MPTLGQMIRKARNDDELTQRELAETLDETANNSEVSRWERDVHRPDKVRMERLVEILGLDEEEAWRAWRKPARSAKRKAATPPAEGWEEAVAPPERQTRRRKAG